MGLNASVLQVRISLMQRWSATFSPRFFIIQSVCMGETSHAPILCFYLILRNSCDGKVLNVGDAFLVSLCAMFDLLKIWCIACVCVCVCFCSPHSNTVPEHLWLLGVVLCRFTAWGWLWPGHAVVHAVHSLLIRLLVQTSLWSVQVRHVHTHLNYPDVTKSSAKPDVP